jgi:hypothetical protein
MTVRRQASVLVSCFPQRGLLLTLPRLAEHRFPGNSFGFLSFDLLF